jgi:predicted transcriptional regulator
MSHTLTIRIQDELARWLADTAKAMSVPQGKIIRDHLEHARKLDQKSKGFSIMNCAGL